MFYTRDIMRQILSMASRTSVIKVMRTCQEVLKAGAEILYREVDQWRAENFLNNPSVSR